MGWVTTMHEFNRPRTRHLRLKIWLICQSLYLLSFSLPMSLAEQNQSTDTSKQKGDLPRFGMLKGKVTLMDKAPKPQIVQLKGDMAKVYGKQTITIQRWKTDANGGLVDCVVTLHNSDKSKRVKTTPKSPATLKKVGPWFKPRLTVIPVGTMLRYENVDQSV